MSVGLLVVSALNNIKVLPIYELAEDQLFWKERLKVLGHSRREQESLALLVLSLLERLQNIG